MAIALLIKERSWQFSPPSAEKGEKKMIEMVLEIVLEKKMLEMVLGIVFWYFIAALCIAIAAAVWLMINKGGGR